MDGVQVRFSCGDAVVAQNETGGEHGVGGASHRGVRAARLEIDLKLLGDAARRRAAGGGGEVVFYLRSADRVAGEGEFVGHALDEHSGDRTHGAAEGAGDGIVGVEDVRTVDVK